MVPGVPLQVYREVAATNIGLYLLKILVEKPNELLDRDVGKGGMDQGGINNLLSTVCGAGSIGCREGSVRPSLHRPAQWQVCSPVCRLQ